MQIMGWSSSCADAPFCGAACAGAAGRAPAAAAAAAAAAVAVTCSSDGVDLGASSALDRMDGLPLPFSPSLGDDADGGLDVDDGDDVSRIPFSTDSVTRRTAIAPLPGVHFIVFPDPATGVSPMTQSMAAPFVGTEPDDETLE